MSQNYQSEARTVLINHLTYNEEEQCYKFFIFFLDHNWGKPNQIALVFDNTGNFMGTEEFIYYKFKNQTMEETTEDHVNYAQSYKETMEKWLKKLMEPIQKENIKINQEKHTNSKYTLKLNFEINDLSYHYVIDTQSPYGSKLECVFQEDSNSFFIEIHHIPLLIGLRHYIRNHHSVRVKYVNELALYEKSKKKVEKIFNVNLEDW